MSKNRSPSRKPDAPEQSATPAVEATQEAPPEPTPGAYIQKQLDEMAERLLSVEQSAKEESDVMAERLLSVETGAKEETARMSGEIDAANKTATDAVAAAVEAEDRATAAEARVSLASVDEAKQEWARRLAWAESSGKEVQAFNLTNHRHLKQVGDSEPELVYGSPSESILVLLPKFINRRYQAELKDEQGNKIRDKHGRPRRGGPLIDNWIPQPEDQNLTISEAATVIDTRPGIAKKRPPLAPPAGAVKAGESARASDTM